VTEDAGAGVDGVVVGDAGAGVGVNFGLQCAQ